MHKQRGVTMIGWIFLLIPMAIVGYAALRVGPEYFNFYKVSTALDETAKQLSAEESLSPQLIRSTLGKRFDTGYIDEPKLDAVQVVKVDKGWQLSAEWEKPIPLFGNLYMLADFKKSVVID